MSDEEPTGSCPACAMRDPHEPILCRVCRSKLRSWLGDIPDLFAELQERSEEMAEPLDHRPYVATVVEKVEQDGEVVQVATRVLTMRAADQVSYHLTTGASSSPSRGGPVSGSRERRLPVDEDVIDLTGPPRDLMPELAYRGPDEVGYDSIASTLDFWVEDWRSDRRAGEGRPNPLVPDLVRWLLDRADDAMDHSAPIAEFFEDIRRVHGALYARLGLFPPRPVHLDGVPCKRCRAGTLWRVPGSIYASECAIPDCAAVLTDKEYEAWTRELAATTRRNGIRRSDRSAA